MICRSMEFNVSNCIFLKFMYSKFQLCYSIKQWIYRYWNMGHLLTNTLYIKHNYQFSLESSYNIDQDFLSLQRWSAISALILMGSRLRSRRCHFLVRKQPHCQILKHATPKENKLQYRQSNMAAFLFCAKTPV